MKRSNIVLAAMSLAALSATVFSRPASASRVHSPRVHQDYPPRPGSTAVFVIGLPNTKPSSNTVGKATTLTATQKNRSQTIALRDSRVKKLLAVKSYRVLGTVQWVIHSALVGGITQLGFTRPVTLSGTWLTLGRSFNATYRNVTRMTIYVNFGQSRVVTIRPH